MAVRARPPDLPGTTIIRPVAGRTYTKPGAGPGEIGIYRIMATLAPVHNDHFTALLLPSAITIDADRGLLVLPRYDGEDLAARWDETDGGAGLGIDLAARIPAVLEDLARIDTTRITADPALSKIPGIAFDHAVALARSAGIARRLIRVGLLTPGHWARAERLLAHQQHTPVIVNNGDFYPRNLIVLPTGRIVIVDWETYGPNSPFHTVDHPENVAAVFYVHMWGNPAWQAAYRAALDEHPAFASAGGKAALVTVRAVIAAGQSIAAMRVVPSVMLVPMSTTPSRKSPLQCQDAWPMKSSAAASAG